MVTLAAYLFYLAVCFKGQHIIKEYELHFQKKTQNKLSELTMSAFRTFSFKFISSCFFV